MARETWYVLEDGSVADPIEVAPDNDGALRHIGGKAVAMRRHDCPSSRSVDADAERAKLAILAGVKSPNDARQDLGLPPVGTKDMKAEQPKRGYKTRETKAD